MTATDLPSPFEDDPDRSDRIAMGVALCRSVLARKGVAGAIAGDPTDETLSPRDRARLRAAQTGDGHRHRDPSSIGDAMRRIKIRKQSTGDTNA
jgi:hypothetical protein